MTRNDILVRVDQAGTGEEADARLARARQGDEEAFRFLYRALSPELLYYAAVLAGQDAGDVVADTWLHLSRELHRSPGDFAGFRRFALTVTRNRAYDLMRHRGRRVRETWLPLTELPDAGHTWTSGASRSRDVAELLGARTAEREAVTRIARLPRAQAEAVLLRVVLDMDNLSAAEVLGRPRGAVAAAMSRGLRRLARTAREDGYGEEVRTRCGTGTSTRRNYSA